MIAALAALIICIFVPAPPAGHDLADLYPGPRGHIAGFNYVTGEPSTLTFTGNGTSWRQTNAANGCHFDAFEWRTTLRYERTHHACEGAVQDTVYTPPIELMPTTWRARDGPWTKTGRSRVVDYADGHVRCTGITEWRSDVNGLEQITPTEQAVHTSTRQRTTWLTGPCAPWVTDWQEDYYFTDHLRRSVGGNLNGEGRWDVWFDP